MNAAGQSSLAGTSFHVYLRRTVRTVLSLWSYSLKMKTSALPISSHSDPRILLVLSVQKLLTRTLIKKILPLPRLFPFIFSEHSRPLSAPFSRRRVTSSDMRLTVTSGGDLAQFSFREQNYTLPFGCADARPEPVSPQRVR